MDWGKPLVVYFLKDEVCDSAGGVLLSSLMTSTKGYVRAKNSIKICKLPPNSISYISCQSTGSGLVSRTE